MRGRPFLVTLLIAVDVPKIPATASMAAGVVRFLPHLVIAVPVRMVGRLVAKGGTVQVGHAGDGVSDETSAPLQLRVARRTRLEMT
jgi:hypothetical protein